MKRIIMMVLKNILFVPWGWFMLSKYAANVDKLYRRREICTSEKNRP